MSDASHCCGYTPAESHLRIERKPSILEGLVGRVGLEPTRPRGQKILSLLRIPFRHRPRGLSSIPYNGPARNWLTAVEPVRDNTKVIMAVEMRNYSTKVQRRGWREPASKGIQAIWQR